MPVVNVSPLSPDSAFHCPASEARRVLPGQPPWRQALLVGELEGCWRRKPLSLVLGAFLPLVPTVLDWSAVQPVEPSELQGT